VVKIPAAKQGFYTVVAVFRMTGNKALTDHSFKTSALNYKFRAGQMVG